MWAVKFRLLHERVKVIFRNISILALPLLLILADFIYDILKPILKVYFPELIKYTAQNGSVFKASLNVIAGGLLTFAGTFIFEKSKEQRKNASYKKQVIYAPIYKELVKINERLHDEQYYGNYFELNQKSVPGMLSFIYWYTIKDNTLGITMNKYIRQVINEYYDFLKLYNKKIYLLDKIMNPYFKKNNFTTLINMCDGENVRLSIIKLDLDDLEKAITGAYNKDLEKRDIAKNVIDFAKSNRDIIDSIAYIKRLPDETNKLLSIIKHLIIKISNKYEQNKFII